MKLQAVVVLYQQAMAESKTIASLDRHFPETAPPMDLLVYDNSPARQASEPPVLLRNPITYVHDPSNGGLVPAYNLGLQLANASGAGWLLLLDQDTDLTGRYFEALAEALRRYDPDPGIAALTPHILARGRCVAPTWFRYGMHRGMRLSWSGVARRPITGINSATVVRTAFLNEMGGFDGEYPLNFTDYWLFREIYRRRKSAAVLDCSLAHEMSSAHRDTFRPVPLYRDILRHEGKFYRSSGSRIVVCVFWLRLMMRVVKHFIVFKDKGYAREALAYIRRELLPGARR